MPTWGHCKQTAYSIILPVYETQPAFTKQP
uniref:Uncharacterized protein n=1 Tax=Anguilla anguilla TaxID=7936 RepID=A0A0E9W3X8_ANGAN